ncbi:hypothetical protein COP1_031455 [Malus domestica]
MGEDKPKKDMEELGTKFGAKLKLSEKELGGICIQRKDVEGALVGLQYTLIAEVLTSKEVNGEAFIDCFMSLWRGREGVSIRDIGDRRFLTRFAGQRDLQRVADSDQPWHFKNDLVMVADRTDSGLNRWAPLSSGMCWVQIHNVPVLSMTQAVAESIGGLLGTVKSVDKSGSRDCIGRFLRVKINFNVREPLMRGTFVNFPDEGRMWVDFKYEGLPKYCLICGLLGHATRVCRGSLDLGKSDGEPIEDRGEGLAFKGLDALTDLRGKPIGVGNSARTPRGSSRGRKDSGRWKDERSEELDGGKRSGRSSTASGMGSHSQLGASRSFSGSDYTNIVNMEEADTAISPNKPRWSSSNLGKERSSLADKIRKQQQEEEDARKAREAAFDAGLIGPGGVIAEGVEHVTLHEIHELETQKNLADVTNETGQSFDLNSELLNIDGNGEGIVDSGEEFRRLLSANGNDVHGTSIEDDPFQLALIIEAVMKEQKGRKRNIQEMELSSTLPPEGPTVRRRRKDVNVNEAEETSRKGSPKDP